MLRRLRIAIKTFQLDPWEALNVAASLGPRLPVPTVQVPGLRAAILTEMQERCSCKHSHRETGSISATAEIRTLPSLSWWLRQ